MYACMSYDGLLRMDDAALVARARARRDGGDQGVEEAKRCVAIVYERHRDVVRVMCAAKLPYDDVDDVAARVYERFVRAVYDMHEEMHSPPGLIVTLTRWCIADF